MERTADRYRWWVQNINKAKKNMKITNKLFKIRVNFKSTRSNVKLSPGSMTGIVTANNEADAKQAAVNFLQSEFIKKSSDVIAVAGKCERVTTKFAINACDWLGGVK